MLSLAAMKKCKTCGIEKPFSEFTLASNQASGLSPHCRDCSKKRLDEWNRLHPESHQAAIEYRREYSRRKRLGLPNPTRRQKRREAGLKLKPVMRPGQKRRMYDEQGARCAICTRFMDFEQSHIDHSHLTGAVRQLLCNTCNTGIGHFGENEELLRAAIVYLRMHEATPKRQPEFISPKPAKKLKHWLDRLP